MEAIELGIMERTGAENAQSIRRAGSTPAVLYGPGRTSKAVVLDAKEFEAKVGTLEGTHLIRLHSTEPELNGRLVLVKEIQRHPLSRDLLHADLYEVDVSTKLTLRVAIHFVGRPVGVDNGGILQPVRREVDVRCLPTEIPQFLTVDVSHLGIHDALHLSDLNAPPGAEIMIDTDEAVVTVLPPVVEEVKVTPDAGGGPSVDATSPGGPDAQKTDGARPPTTAKAGAGS
jgi:large subunit ribosomal protein L25